MAACIYYNDARLLESAAVPLLGTAILLPPIVLSHTSATELREVCCDSRFANGPLLEQRLSCSKTGRKMGRQDARIAMPSCRPSKRVVMDLCHSIGSMYILIVEANLTIPRITTIDPIRKIPVICILRDKLIEERQISGIGNSTVTASLRVRKLLRMQNAKRRFKQWEQGMAIQSDAIGQRPIRKVTTQETCRAVTNAPVMIQMRVKFGLAPLKIRLYKKSTDIFAKYSGIVASVDEARKTLEFSC